MLQVKYPDLDLFRNKLAHQDVRLPAPLSDGSGFRLGINESWGRITSSDLAGMFVQAVEA